MIASVAQILDEFQQLTSTERLEVRRYRPYVRTT